MFNPGSQDSPWGRRETFVIGDVHGHGDRLKALLQKAGFLDADGAPTALTNTAKVIQLGDLGHYDKDSQARDLACWSFAHRMRGWFKVIMGNHDMAVSEPNYHRFRGYVPPISETHGLMAAIDPPYALESHGYLLTHAGLHPGFALMTNVADGLVDKVKFHAVLLNLMCDVACPVRDNISEYRGGTADGGGILWRDSREALAPIKQIFGHTRSYDVRRTDGDIKDASWCIDVADRDNDWLAGIWLPSLEVVAVGPDAKYIEVAND